MSTWRKEFIIFQYVNRSLKNTVNLKVDYYYKLESGDKAVRNILLLSNTVKLLNLFQKANDLKTSKHKIYEFKKTRLYYIYQYI